MSIRGTDEKAIGDERRRGSGKRVRFEALVAVGDAEGGAGFEAESLDVSPEGMRLRTAYLPEVGDRLICRFEGAGTEVLAEAEVTWREEQERGGEFGLRFLKLDADAAERLRVMCAPTEAEGATDDAPVPMGARVRLHIDGLASPMKARVREASTGELRVGSNLEFLRVGQKLDLEDVDQKGKRNVVIDHVAVEIDPETNVPQLVVSLRYPSSKAATAAAAGASVAAGVAAAAAAGTMAERVSKTLISPRPDAPVAPLAKGSSAPVEKASSSELSAPSSADGEMDVAVDDEEQEAVDKMHAGLRGAGAKAKAKAKAMADKLGPTLASMAGKSKEKLGAMFAKLAKNREERAVAKKAAGPRRTTSPPPKGALTSEGRRLVRDDEPEVSEPISVPKRKLGRSAVIGGLLGIFMVIGIVSASKLMGAHSAVAESAAPAADVAALPAAPAPAEPGSGGTVVANVPLFGATPLSTTEPVPTAPPTDPALAQNGADPLLQAANAAVAGPDEEEGPGAGQAGENDEGDPDDVATDVTEWGSGKVRSPVVLKLKMDGDVSRLDGAKGAMGFTISVPGRRALGTGAELAKKDKRIAAVDVVNTGSGAEVTVRFKDGVPPYLVKAHGARLEIAIGSDGKGKTTKAVASKKNDGKSKKVDAKKSSKGKTDKKAASKAKPAKKTTAKH